MNSVETEYPNQRDLPFLFYQYQVL